MTAEQMASKKLAEWRQNELNHELDIIEVGSAGDGRWFESQSLQLTNSWV